MQKATAKAINSMNLQHNERTLIDACCATGSLYFGLKKSVVLNDLNPLRTVLKQHPLKLFKSTLSSPVFSNKEQLSEYMKSVQAVTKEYEAKRMHYHRVDYNIATMTFIFQCISKQYPEDKDKILKRISASIKLQNATITQEDCIKYLNNDINKFVLLDVPYIGSEYSCSAKGYNYCNFHKKIADKLYNADYPFLYYCRNTPSKANNPQSEQGVSHIQKLKLAQYFFNKEFYFEKIYLRETPNLHSAADVIPTISSNGIYPIKI